MFSVEERAEIARLFSAKPGSEKANRAIGAIENALRNCRAGRTRRQEADAVADAALAERYRFVAKRGRPRGRQIDSIAECYVLASVYESLAHAPHKNSRSHPFYRLAQICLRVGDPSKLIAAMERPPWNFSKRHRALASAAAVYCKAFADGLRADDC